MSKSSAIQKAIAVFREHNGVLRTAEAIRLGIQPRTLYAMRDSGVVERMARGLYRLAELPPLGNPDLVAVALTAPKSVICLVSALAFHEITTQVPHEVHIAVERGKSRRPQIEHPPVRIFWLGGNAFHEGIDTHVLDGIEVRVYCPEKTVADCFKYRNKIGLDVVVEALRLCRQRKRSTVDRLMHFARVDRVENIMRPYLEAML